MPLLLLNIYPAETREYIPIIQHYIKQFGPKPKSWTDDPAIAKMFNSNEVKQLNFKTAIKDNALKRKHHGRYC